MSGQMIASGITEKTNDKVIRFALRERIREHHTGEHFAIIEELGLTHGTARVDMVVINGSMHGYELKSDMDTLLRLPDQMKIYNSTLDRITLVVGKTHIHQAINMIPDWWGIIMAKIAPDGSISLLAMREADQNPAKSSFAIAQLLWRNEALHILEELNSAEGVRSKPREFLYEKLSEILDQDSLSARVRERLFNREGWRVA